MKTKKELKKQYQQQKPKAGVFQVLNKVNGKVLIEGDKNIPSKWNRHRTELRFGSHRNKQLQEDWNKEGEENFIFSIVSELEFEEVENLNLQEEIKLLKEIVEEEMNIKKEMKY